MRRSAVTHAAGLAAVLALKLFQHGAGADDLAFLLAPACALASLATGYVFVHEAGAGWVSHAHRFIAGPSCAGMTFLIAGFAAFYFPFVARFETWRSRAGWLLASLAAAFAVALPANALRIALAVRLYEMDALYGAVVTPLRVHRAMGCAVYLTALLLSFLALERAFRRAPSSPLVPLGWYLAIVLGIPVARGAFRRHGEAFAEHAIFVGAVCLVLAAVPLLARRVVLGSGPCEAEDPRRGR